MKLSIIVICLNEEAHLGRCLKAIRELDHDVLETELIVIDGGSTDCSRDIALSYGARVLEGPRGIPLQRNLGARVATGDVLAYVDADVEILDGWFATVTGHFRGSHYKILGCPPRLPSDASWIARTYALHLGLNHEGPQDQPSRHVRLLSTQSLVMGRDVFVALGGFRQDLGVDEDTFLLLEAKQQNIPLVYDAGLAYVHYGEPRTLREFFFRIRWGSNYVGWYKSILRGELAQARRPQYLYGAAIAAEVGLLGLSLLSGQVWDWLIGVPISLGLLAISFFLPAVRTAIRQRALGKVGQLCLMYGAYGLAMASAMVGLGWNKAARWR